MMNNGQTWRVLKQCGGVGGSPFANKMICITMPYCKHDDDIVLLCNGKHGWPSQQPGVGYGDPPPLANNKDEDDKISQKLLKDDTGYESQRR